MRKIEEFKDREIEGLLERPYKTIREPVHEDIQITRLEAEIIDTKSFQRLRRIRQLGATHLIYPGAMHTRFDHSLGTLHMAQKIVDTVNNNRDSYISIDAYPHLLIRLCALLHDVVCITFGHTLEDEGNLFPAQWKDKNRVETFLGGGSEIGQIIKSKAGSECLRDVKRVLEAQEEEEIKKLDYPYVADIVSNTLCADLLDYIKRDVYFTGIREAYDDRFLSYLVLKEDPEIKKPRLVLKLFKEKHNMKAMRRDVLSEVLHLLRLRYSLAEKVYYQHAKIAVSAMIIATVNAARVQQKLSDKTLNEVGDDDLLTLLENEGGEISRYIITKIRKREIYTPIYQLTFSEEGAEIWEAEKKKELTNKFRSPKIRFEQERLFEEWNDFPNGSVIIYCPSREMGHKAAKTRILWQDGKIYPLEEIPDRSLRPEVEEIGGKYEKLWKMYVFVDRTISEDAKKNIAFDCQGEFGLPNTLSAYQEAGSTWIHRAAINWSKEHPEMPEITVEELRKLQSRAVSAYGPPVRKRSDVYKLIMSLRGGKAEKEGME